MKTAIKTLAIITTILWSMIAGGMIMQQSAPAPADHSDTTIINTMVLENGKTAHLLANGLEVVIYHPTATYELYIPFMADHSLSYASEEILWNGVAQYSSGLTEYLQK